MKNKITLLISLVVLLALSYFAFSFFKNNTASKNENIQTDILRLIKTNPDPLDNATILPTQDLEFTFSQPIYRTELKHHFDPEIPHTVEIVNGIDTEHGTTVKIKFNEPLELGSGYTLFIESSTKVNDMLRLDRDYIYHFKTIGYRGV